MRLSSKDTKLNSSSFIDQNLVFVNERFYVLGKSTSTHQINFPLEKFRQFELITEEFHSDRFGIVEFHKNIKIAALPGFVSSE